MNQAFALRQLAERAHLDAAALITYAAEDTIGGFDFDLAQRQWDVGSMWAIEAQVIYALVRATKPLRVLEIGVGNGCTSTHILTALHANKQGKLLSLDPSPYTTSLVPKALRKRWQHIPQDAVAWLDEHPAEATFDMVVEDGPHSAEFTQAVLERAKGKIVISHDAAHFLVGEAVRAGFTAALGSCEVYNIEPADCGLAIWIGGGA